MYKYLLFDLDDTLLDFKTAEKTAISLVLKNHGLPFDDQTVKLYSAINDSCWKEYERGEIKRDDIYTKRFITLGQRLNLLVNHEKLAADYFAELSKQGQTFSGTTELLRTLRSKGYVMAATTNGSLIVQTGRIIASGIGGFFSGGIYISEQIGLKKPEPEFFEYVLNAMDIKNKSQVLVLGDSPTSDIKGANDCGLDCCFVSLKGCPLPKNTTATYTAYSFKDIEQILR